MDWQALLKTVAPWIGTAIAGPAGPLVDMAITAAASALGISEPTADKVKAALSGMTPEQTLALKQADNQFQEHMQQMGFTHIEQLEAIAAGDRASARDLQKSSPSIIPPTLAIVVTVGFLGLLAGMASKYLTLTDSPTLQLLLGMLATAWTSIISYYFGSSAGSARKDELAAGAPPRT